MAYLNNSLEVVTELTDIAYSATSEMNMHLRGHMADEISKLLKISQLQGFEGMLI